MRLVEVVMLMGAHCVSPVEHSQMMTDAAKVQCAVVIEKDTDKGTMTVTPREAAQDPQVLAAVERFRLAPADPLSGGGTKIVPAWAPAGSPPVEIKPPEVKSGSMAKPAAPAATPDVATQQADAADAAQPPAAATDTAAAAADDPTATPADDAATTADTAAPAAEEPAPVPLKKKKQASSTPAPHKQAAAKAAPAKKPAATAAAKPAAPATEAVAQPKQSDQCKGQAVAKWYKTADGKKKYRCVKPAGDDAPDQLY